MIDLLNSIYPADTRIFMRHIFDQISTNYREELINILVRFHLYRKDTDEDHSEYIEPYIKIKNQLLLDRDQLHKLMQSCLRHSSFWVNNIHPTVSVRIINIFWNRLIKLNIILFRVYYMRSIRISHQNIIDP